MNTELLKPLSEEFPDYWMVNCPVADSSQSWLIAGRFALCYYSYEYGDGVIDRANYESYQEALEGRDFRETNIEGYTLLLIHPNDTEAIETVKGLLDDLVNYPLLDDDKVYFCDVCDKLHTYDDECCD
jgi:hypothetical protein